MTRLKCLLLSCLPLLGATSCAYDSPLKISSETPSVTVFHGSVTNGTGDAAETVSGPGFFYGPVTLQWKGDKNLKLLSMVINFKPIKGKISNEIECTFDSDLLGEAFPTATDLTLTPNQKVVSSGRFVCTGITPENEKANFIITGLAKIRGVTGGAGDQKFYRGETRLSFYYFPKGD